MIFRPKGFVSYVFLGPAAALASVIECMTQCGFGKSKPRYSIWNKGGSYELGAVDRLLQNQ